MAVTSSLYEPPTKRFTMSARRVEIIRRYQKQGALWLRIHQSLVLSIERHIKVRMPHELRPCMEDRYLLPLRADRYDEETNMKKFATEIALSIAEPNVVRSIHFIAPVVCEHTIRLCEFFKDEFFPYVISTHRSTKSERIIFDFIGTPAVQKS